MVKVSNLKEMALKLDDKTLVALIEDAKARALSNSTHEEYVRDQERVIAILTDLLANRSITPVI